MELKPLFYSFLILCVIVFFEVLINIRKNSLLKICFLLIIVSLFIMNYFSYYGISSRIQFVFVKTMRIICMLSGLLVIIQVASSRIPRWIVWVCIGAFVFVTGMRMYFFNQIDIGRHISSSNLIFSVGNEFYKPAIIGRLIIFSLLLLLTGIILYYYRVFLKKSNKGNIYYNQLSRWILAFIAPMLLLIFFGILALLNVFNISLSSYLFSFFSFMIILSILFRPKFLNVSQVSLALVPIQKQGGAGISAQAFNSIFFTEFYYLNKDASLMELAGKLETTDTAIRDFLQHEYGMGLNDLVNKHRISYMLDLLKDQQNRHFTIEHLSQKAGFPSRSTMYRAFSRFHGGHPSEYINKLNGL